MVRLATLLSVVAVLAGGCGDDMTEDSTQPDRPPVSSAPAVTVTVAAPRAPSTPRRVLVAYDNESDGRDATLVDMHTGQEWQLSDEATAASVSPDGKRVAYSLNGDGTSALPDRLYIARLDGSEARQLPAPGPIIDTIAWLPGDALAYSRGANDYAFLNVIDGDQVEDLGSQPDWFTGIVSPDGSQTVFGDPLGVRKLRSSAPPVPIFASADAREYLSPAGWLDDGVAILDRRSGRLFVVSPDGGKTVRELGLMSLRPEPNGIWSVRVDQFGEWVVYAYEDDVYAGKIGEPARLLGPGDDPTVIQVPIGSP